MPGDRMTRMWAPVHFDTETLGAGGVARADCLQTLETSLGRDLRSWTVTRVVGTLQFWSAAEVESFYGMRVENENVPLGTIDPEPDATADWLFWGGQVTGGYDIARLSDAIQIDNRSQRKSQGEQSKLFFYWENAGGGDLYTTIHARVLLLLP